MYLTVQPDLDAAAATAAAADTAAPGDTAAPTATTAVTETAAPTDAAAVTETAPTTELSRLPLELIEREIEQLASRINAGSARWLELVGEFDRRTGWANSGCRSTCEWVAWRCGLSPRSAREQVRVARALRALPRTRASFAAGRLSYSKVRALTRVADPGSEAELLELARHATAAQLERIVRAARRVTTAEADAQQRESYLRYYWDDDDGSLRIEAKLAPEDGALFLRALESARDALAEQRADEAEERAVAAESGADDAEQGAVAAESRAVANNPAVDGSAGPLAANGPSGSAEPSTRGEGVTAPAAPSPTNAECVAAIAETALARPPSGLAGGERQQLIVHVDAETLATDRPGAQATGGGSCSIADGPGIAPETVRRLACDCSFVAALERDGKPLSVGRRTRSVPPAIRRALLVRDGRCQFPGCERRRFVDAHHIVHWARGGETRLDNLVLLCRHHHRLVHERGFTVGRDPGSGRLAFRTPDGIRLEPAPAPPCPRGGLPARAGPLLTGSGEAIDLRSCVDAVLAATAGPATVPAARAAGGPG